MHESITAIHNRFTFHIVTNGKRYRIHCLQEGYNKPYVLTRADGVTPIEHRWLWSSKFWFHRDVISSPYHETEWYPVTR